MRSFSPGPGGFRDLGISVLWASLLGDERAPWQHRPGPEGLRAWWGVCLVPSCGLSLAPVERPCSAGLECPPSVPVLVSPVPPLLQGWGLWLPSEITLQGGGGWKTAPLIGLPVTSGQRAGEGQPWPIPRVAEATGTPCVVLPLPPPEPLATLRLPLTFSPTPTPGAALAERS